LYTEVRKFARGKGEEEMDPRVKPEDDEACHSREGGNPASIN
jgi:hypothetical protein